jgi:hypothetical protein
MRMYVFAGALHFTRYTLLPGLRTHDCDSEQGLRDIKGVFLKP